MELPELENKAHSLSIRMTPLYGDNSTEELEVIDDYFISELARSVAEEVRGVLFDALMKIPRLNTGTRLTYVSTEKVICALKEALG
ncbi:hypothetical protein HN512_04760 [Candidatus Peregrinibacteria bacterium]|jgi:hypothetical protein|nr:hypothetical protein [Candidatus Peregrinibacteria bacterium]MBT3599116.1 hypothetical protein [Candidatus Peregrinibacteria bacterium]MBT4367504.1 hypothetical protein [Candidatus Peregrinibacteria bacterium]MBT4585984.1 hypothetical protein [Candidatus Peregrinibacteria bacterium]MBT6730756.1 hypothetical protein [Candidatus Peregrinibacteria bacterium]